MFHIVSPFDSWPSPGGEGRTATVPLTVNSPVSGKSSRAANNEHNGVSRTHLHILYYNARSLLSKLDELRATVALEQPHIVCIVEAWLSPDIADNKLQICGYQLVRLDRSRRGGGILMYVNDVFSFRVLLESGPHNLEF